MKLPKFLLSAFLITFCSLSYVRQQTEIFRLAYVGQKDMLKFQDLLDTNSNLRYNFKKNTSLIRIGSKISQSSEFEMPQTYRLVKLASPEKGLRLADYASPKRENLVSRIFSVKRQAEAKTINR